MTSEEILEYEPKVSMLPYNDTPCGNDTYTGTMYNVTDKNQLGLGISSFGAPGIAEDGYLGQPGDYTKGGVEYKLAYSVHAGSWISYPSNSEKTIAVNC
jgi:hypothetical protein